MLHLRFPPDSKIYVSLSSFWTWMDACALILHHLWSYSRLWHMKRIVDKVCLHCQSTWTSFCIIQSSKSVKVANLSTIWNYQNSIAGDIFGRCFSTSDNPIIWYYCKPARRYVASIKDYINLIKLHSKYHFIETNGGAFQWSGWTMLSTKSRRFWSYYWQL